MQRALVHGARGEAGRRAASDAQVEAILARAFRTACYTEFVASAVVCFTLVSLAVATRTLVQHARRSARSVSLLTRKTHFAVDLVLDVVGSSKIS
jgi:hypothetical protein